MDVVPIGIGVIVDGKAPTYKYMIGAGIMLGIMETGGNCSGVYDLTKWKQKLMVRGLQNEDTQL